jgi:hypothetical protein
LDKDLAHHVAMTAWQSFGKLERLIPLLRKHCGQDEFKIYLKAIAVAGSTIHHEILDRVICEHPELEKDLDEKVAKYQKWI